MGLTVRVREERGMKVKLLIKTSYFVPAADQEIKCNKKLHILSRSESRMVLFKAKNKVQISC